MTFECTGCGHCCRHVDRTLDRKRNPRWLWPAMDAFPYEVDENGVCEKLVGDECSVYENRPLMCNITEAARQIDMPMTQDEWYRQNTIGCMMLQQEAK